MNYRLRDLLGFRRPVVKLRDVRLWIVTRQMRRSIPSVSAGFLCAVVRSVSSLQRLVPRQPWRRLAEVLLEGRRTGIFGHEGYAGQD